MAFDPSLPVNNASVKAAELRGQFNGLFDLIQAIPAGPPGPAGPAGVSVTGAVVDGVSTVQPAFPATATASFDGTTVRFTFGIPSGLDGFQGPQGEQGPVGPVFTNFAVNATTTLDPGQPATVTAILDENFFRFSFGIPRGNDGPQGIPGNDGLPGPAGLPGEVTAAALDTAIIATAQNPSALIFTELTVSDPPTQAEVQTISDRLNALLAALQRV